MNDSTQDIATPLAARVRAKCGAKKRILASAAVIALLASSAIATVAMAIELVQSESDVGITTTEDGAPIGADGLSSDLEDLQEQIDTEFATDRKILESRQQVTELLRQAGAAAQAGDLAGADTILRQAFDAVLPGDLSTRNRVTLVLANLKIRAGDLEQARVLLSSVAASGELSPLQKSRLEALEARLTAAATDAERQSIMAEIASLPDIAAIDRARQEAESDPENLNLRLLLGDLLRKAGQLAEAQQVAEKLASEAEAVAQVGVRQRALVLLARVAIDRGNLAAAREYVEQLRDGPDTAQKEDRIAGLVERIEREESRATESAQQAARRQAVEEIQALPLRAAIVRAQAVVAADPQNYDARLTLSDLLRKSGRLGEARALGDALVSETAKPDLVGVQQRTLILLGRIAIDQDDFRLARNYLLTLRATPETNQKAARVADFERRIAVEQKRHSDRLAADRTKRMEAARRANEKAQVAAEKARIDAELDAIAAAPAEEALQRASAIYAANPGNMRIANTYGRLLAREWRDEEAEQVYLDALGSPEAATDAGLVERSALVFGLVDLYSRTNQMAKANALLVRLDEAYRVTGATATDRAIALRARVDQALQPNQVSGSITVSGGYNSNVSTSFDDNDPDEDLIPQDVGAGFFEADARFRYDRVISPNGDKFRFQARWIGRPYIDIDNADRITADLNGGFVYHVPGTRTTLTALAGYRARYVDYDLYRRTAYGLLNVSADFSRRIDGASTFVVEANDDDDDTRDGYALQSNWRLGYRITDSVRTTLGLDTRYEDATLESEGRWSIAPVLAIRANFSIGGMTGFFATGAYSPSFTRYNAVVPTGADAGILREDVTQKVSLTMGREFSPEWRAALGLTYVHRDSTIASRNDSATQIMLGITRSFGTN